MVKVLKFGGTSVGSAVNMRRVADIIIKEGAAVVVLSAMSGTTDLLARAAALTAEGGNALEVENIVSELKNKYKYCAGELLSAAAKKEAYCEIESVFSMVSFELGNYDGVFSDRIIIAQGELLTSKLFAMYMTEAGCAIKWLYAPGFMVKDADDAVSVDRIGQCIGELDKDILYITQGFVCSDANGRMDNLGRGGSDYSAALIGAALGASEVQIWTDIDGMHNNDPRFVDGTFPIRRLHFDEAAELAYFGAKILHPSTIQPCKEYGIPVLLKNTMQPEAMGTVISDEEDYAGIYRAVAGKDNITVVRIYSTRMLMAYGFLRKVFEVFEKYRTPIDMITTSEVAVSLTIDSSCRLSEIVGELESYGRIEVETDNSIVCVVGRLDHRQHGRAFAIMQAVGDVPLKMISYGASHRSLSLLVDTCYKVRLLRNLNDVLFSEYAEQ